MLKVNCPSCGAEVKFLTGISIFAVCAYCRSTLVRHDRDVESFGKMAILQDEWSPLQIGTAGKYLGANFTLVGRVRQTWERGNWNEWFCYFDDARHGWLSEAQGFYHFSVPLEGDFAAPEFTTLSPGSPVEIQDQFYAVKDIKNVVCSFSEGELPFKAVTGRASHSVDLASTANGFACIDYSEDGVSVYCGHYLAFDDFRFSLLREIDGWGKPS